VERDACALWWYNRLRRPGIDLGSFRSPYLDRMQELYNRHGRTLIALDVTSDLGIPAVVALSWREPDGGRIHVGLGTHLDGALAVSRAVSELSQSTHAEFSPGSEKQNTHGPELADLDRWMAEATIASDPHVLPAPGSLRVAADFPSLSSGDLRDDVAGCIELLRTQGLEMIVLEHTRPDIGFPVMRVTVPGLRHFWERLAPGRLYSIPAAMGWLKQPLCEEELNPKPFFI
jgi:ribosomal protein S12 methylthiotransferase accessory factor